jgi:small subunit ribosomal protein S8
MGDILAETLVQMKNAERIGRSECIVHKVSNLLREVLAVMKKEGYIGEYELIDDGRGGILKIQLLGKINDAGAIKPRFSVKQGEYEKFEKRYLPAKDFGLLILSTTKGVVTHHHAKKAGMGGQLLAYIY